jgi:hypothetical protein
MRTRRFLACILLAVTTLPALALDRPFPKTAIRAKMSLSAYPDLLIDGKARILSHTLRIWNADNRLERPSHLRGTGFIINYTENAKGDVDRIWILNQEEASRPPSAQDVSRVR